MRPQTRFASSTYSPNGTDFFCPIAVKRRKEPPSAQRSGPDYQKVGSGDYLVKKSAASR